ncbi:class I SAM-dependent methyltransferase [Paenibacillus amylolyticus]|uniref:class I SAM-dependent methyltransferase n=1 Tax=Paenibacillus amylolyticus TaxID=1451 RepID=UPI003EBBC14E
MENDQIKSQVQKQFSHNAEHYVTSEIHAQGEDLALLVASSQAAEHMSVLDIATGGGHVANALAPLVGSVTALDLTEGMLEVAARFIRGNGHENVDFVTGDAEHIPFPDNSFDLVTCRIAAHHFPAVSSFASEAYRVTKPGGCLLFIDNVAPEKDELDRFYNGIEKQRDPSHVRAWGKTEWIGLLEQTGYRVETLVSFAKKFNFDDWCRRASLCGEARLELEAKLLHAKEEARHYFKVAETEQGGLLSFEGESVYIQALKR